MHTFNASVWVFRRDILPSEATDSVLFHAETGIYGRKNITRARENNISIIKS